MASRASRCWRRSASTRWSGWSTSGEARRCGRQHTAYYLGAAEAAEPQLYDPEQRALARSAGSGARQPARGAALGDRAARIGPGHPARRRTGVVLVSYAVTIARVAHWLEAASGPSSSADLTLSAGLGALLCRPVWRRMPDDESARGGESGAVSHAGRQAQVSHAFLMCWRSNVRAQGDTARAEALFGESVALLQELGDTRLSMA